MQKERYRCEAVSSWFTEAAKDCVVKIAKNDSVVDNMLYIKIQ